LERSADERKTVANVREGALVDEQFDAGPECAVAALSA
jgi:hypothetical protein